jgi:hypothetical protein
MNFLMYYIFLLCVEIHHQLHNLLDVHDHVLFSNYVGETCDTLLRYLDFQRFFHFNNLAQNS